ncbi:DUF6988 family protein [Luteimonas panaciterrae]|uniref:DUF6988 family protein n=1 Tax=Luteimonas panaciterrae TaxID=363885 RepID=UPI001CFBEC03|nr:hypothetical protein [Luteimonas panaciterrae]
MPSDRLIAVRARCAESRLQHEILYKLIPKSVPSRIRFDLARSCVDLAQEHHSSVVRLIDGGFHAASAAALLRPLLEAGSIAFWLMYCAPNHWVQGLHRACEGEESTYDTPDLDSALSELRKVFPAIGPLADGLKNKGPAAWLHKYTHGGVLQLYRRKLPEHWSTEELIAHVIIADHFANLAAAICTRIYDAPELAAYVFPRRDSLALEIQAMTGQQAPEGQPAELPVITLKDDWDSRQIPR